MDDEIIVFHSIGKYYIGDIRVFYEEILLMVELITQHYFMLLPAVSG